MRLSFRLTHVSQGWRRQRGLAALTGLFTLATVMMPAQRSPALAASVPAANAPRSGYWLAASDGGIFAFGDAEFYGSTGGMVLNRAIVSMAATPAGKGYWLTAGDGGIFAFGDAGFHGAAPERAGGKPTPLVVGLVPTATGAGYWQVAEQGDVLAFGDAADLGGSSGLNRPLVAMAALPPASVSEQRPGSEPINGASPGEFSNPGHERGAGPPPTTTTTRPVAGPPTRFSSTFASSQGTSPSKDPTEAGRSKAGRVLAVAEAGNVVFVAGEFAGVTPPGVSTTATTKDPTVILHRPYLVALDANTGALLDWNAQPNEAVLSLAVSPDGRRLYVGGRFRKIGGGRPAGSQPWTSLPAGSTRPSNHRWLTRASGPWRSAATRSTSGAISQDRGR